MAIQDLISVVQPPASPIEIGVAGQWEAVQKDIGTRLPDDFREFGMAFGSGSFVDPGRMEVFTYQPFSHEFLEKAHLHSSALSAMKAAEGNRYIPFEIHPTTPGLLAWGSDVNSNELYWLTAGDPNDWPIIVRSDINEFERFAGPMTSFLAQVFSGRLSIRVWPTPFFEQPSGVLFVPSPPSAGQRMIPATLYQLYVQNGNRAGFWARDIGAQPGVIYYIKGIDGKMEGPIDGIPVEYNRQPVQADLYLRDKLFEEDTKIPNAHRSVFELTGSPLGQSSSGG